MPAPAVQCPAQQPWRLPRCAFVAVAATLALAPIPAASETWTIAPVVREGAHAIVAELAAAGGTSAFTLETSDQDVLAVPAIALGDGGRAVAAWVREKGPGSELAAAQFDGRAWGRPVVVAASGRYLGQPTLAATADGGYWIAAVRDAGRGDDIVLFRWQGDAAREVVGFGEPGAPDIDPRLTRAASGEVRLSWRSFGRSGYRRQEKVVEAGATAGGADRVEAAADEPLPPDGQGRQGRYGVAWTDGTRLLSAPLTDEPRAAAAPGVPTLPAAAPESVVPVDLSRILGLGDSTTWGRGSSYGGPPTDYLTRLENRLRGPWTVHNGGHPGYTAGDLLAAADSHLALRPGLTLLMVGINDALERHSFDTVAANVQALVDKARAAGSVVILATTTPVIDSGPRADQHRYLAEVVNPAIRAVAAAANVRLVDIWGYFAGLPNWRDYIYAPHGNHLTDAGYELVASRFSLVFEKNDLRLPAAGTARGPLLADVRLGVWELPVRGARSATANAGAAELVRDAVSALADNGIVAAAPVDLDGDGIDGVAVLRARSGALTLTVHTSPPAGTLEPAAVRAAVTVEAEATWLPGVCACPEGQTRAARSITHLFALDQDGDGRDEFGIVCNRTCAPAAGSSLERQVVEVWRAHQPGGAAPRRLVADEWRLPAGGRIHDIAAVQADADPAQEILLLTQTPRVAALHTLGSANPDAIALLESGRYGRLLDCATAVVPAGSGICGRWKSRGQCGLLELRTLTPRALVYDTPRAGAATRAANNEPLLYSWWFTDSPQIAVHCVETGEEWVERRSDVLGIAAADIDRPANGRDEVLVLRLRAVDQLEAWSLPAAAGTLPRLAALDRWVRTDPSAQYLLRAGSIPDGSGGTRPSVFLWLNRKN